MSTIPEEIKELSPFWGKPKEFKAFLNKEPSKKTIKKGPNGNYIGISTLEKTMDLAFGPGLWWKNYQAQNMRDNVIQNEITQSVSVTFIHPILKREVTIGGLGAAMIMLNAGSKSTDIQNKKINATQSAYPLSGAMAFRNAVSPLGKIFGRDTGRKDKDVEIYSSILTGRELAAFTEIMTATETIDEASEVWIALPEAMQTEIAFATTYNQHVMNLRMEQMALPESTDQIEIEFEEAAGSAKLRDEMEERGIEQ